MNASLQAAEERLAQPHTVVVTKTTTTTTSTNGTHSAKAAAHAKVDREVDDLLSRLSVRHKSPSLVVCLRLILLYLSHLRRRD